MKTEILNSCYKYLKYDVNPLCKEVSEISFSNTRYLIFICLNLKIVFLYRDNSNAYTKRVKIF